MSLAIFDLDNTLIGGDSDYSWGQFLIEKGVVDIKAYKTANDQFYEDYRAGVLDMAAYVAFTLTPLRNVSRHQRAKLHREFMTSKIEALMLPKAIDLIEQHRENGHTLLIITATNRFITAPIAKRLGIKHLLATEVEIKDDQFTGKIAGVPCYQKGKVTRLQQWLIDREEVMEGSFFYSDSFNDLPLLETVTHPHAVDPDDALRKHAQTRHWPIISLR